MAKTKAVEVESEETTHETKGVDWKALALANEQKCYEALERVEKLEEFMCRILPDLHLAAKYFHSVQVAAGGRMEKQFIEARTLLGVKGDAVDRAMRGVN
jgi:hypothetical protein